MILAKIFSPNKDYSGISANVLFVNGFGECNTPHVIKWFKEHGYSVEEDIPENKNDVPENDVSEDIESIHEEAIDYETMDYQELKKLASDKGINTYKLKKVDIIKELQKQELEG